MDERHLLEDWAQLISFRPDLVLRPTSIDELKTMLERVHRLPQP